MPINNELYSKYVSTHIVNRKGKIDESRLKDWLPYLDLNWAPLIPTDRNTLILDAACGHGTILWWLQKKGYLNTEGIDISSEQIELANKLGVKNVHVDDLKIYLGKKHNSYDVIIMKDILEHFQKDAITEIISSCSRALNANGRLIIQVPNAASPFFGSALYGDFTHEIAFTISSLEQVLLLNGFKSIYFHEPRKVVRSIKSVIHRMLYMLLQKILKYMVFIHTLKKDTYLHDNIIAVAKKTV